MSSRAAVSRSGDDSALPPDERELLERARALIPRLAERAPAATAARQLPAETIAEYHDAGILRILQPRRFGGVAGPVQPVLPHRRGTDLGLRLLGLGLRGAGRAPVDRPRYPEQAQIDVWGDDPLAVVASSLAPRAAGDTRDDRRLAAQRPLQRFPAAAITRSGRSSASFSARSATRATSPICWCRSAEVEIVDDWQVLGLAGTGSKSLVLHDVFVPEHRTA